MSYSRAWESRERDGWAGLILQAWEEISMLPSAEDAVERIRLAGFDPVKFVQMVRMAEEWKEARGARFQPRQRGGPGDIDARYEFRVSTEDAGRVRATIVERASGEILWEETHLTAARALGAMSREARRLRPSPPDGQAGRSRLSADLEPASVWLDAAQTEYVEAMADDDHGRRRLASADLAAAREYYTRIVTGMK